MTTIPELVFNPEERPIYIRDEDVVEKLVCSSRWLPVCGNPGWYSDSQYRLRDPNHPYNRFVAAGMDPQLLLSGEWKLWHGGEDAPGDLGAEILLSGMKRALPSTGDLRWKHEGTADIVAYKVATAPATTPKLPTEAEVRAWYSGETWAAGTSFMTDKAVETFRHFNLLAIDPDPYQQFLSEHGITHSDDVRKTWDALAGEVK